MNRIQKQLNALVTVVMVLSTLLCLFVCVQLIAGREASVLGFRLYRIQTGSMEPTIATGTIILVRETEPQDLKTGDIITFISRDPAIYGAANTHRIVSIETDDSGALQFVTKGDANPTQDSIRVSASDIKGKVAFYMSGSVSLFFGFLHTRMGFVLVIVLPMMLIIWLFMRDFRREMDNYGREKAEQEMQEANHTAETDKSAQGLKEDSE